MNNIPARLKIGGSANHGNSIQATYPICEIKNQDYVKVVKLTNWCKANFITVRIGYKLIRLDYLLAFRRHHIWWVKANPNCLEKLLDYLGLEKLYFDAPE